MPIPVLASSVFVVCGARVLLGMHRKERMWLPVGGKHRVGETPLEAARREAFEETDCRPTFVPNPTGVIGAPDGFFAYEEHRAVPSGQRFLCFAFVATVDDAALVTLCAREFSATRWFTKAELWCLEPPPASRHVPQLALRALALVKETRYGRMEAPALDAPSRDEAR